MSVDISRQIMHSAAPMLWPASNKDDNADPDESDAIVPSSSDGTYPGEFGTGVPTTVNTETQNPAYSQLPPLESDYPSVGISSFVRVVPDIGGEIGLRGNVPYTGPGPVTGGSTSLGNSWLDGRTIRIRRKAESSAGPVGQNDYASSLQYGLYQQEMQMAYEEASRASIAMAV